VGCVEGGGGGGGGRYSTNNQLLKGPDLNK